MKNIILFIFVFLVALYAENPKVYSALGDVIYNNAHNIEKLASIKEFSSFKPKIEKYIDDVNKTKKIGFDLELGYQVVDKKAYLDTLRRLSKTNDFFIREVDIKFRNALRTENSKLFDKMINSSLLNTQKYKSDIIEYYFNHSNELNTTGLIQHYLDEDAALKAKQEAQRKRYKTKRQRELERIKYLREKDKLEQEKLEKQLEKKLKEKKLEIREYQEKELSKTI
jgi:hypothetical protein